MWMTVRYERMSRRTFDLASAQLCGYWHHPALGATGCEEEDREVGAALSRRCLAEAISEIVSQCVGFVRSALRGGDLRVSHGCLAVALSGTFDLGWASAGSWFVRGRGAVVTGGAPSPWPPPARGGGGFGAGRGRFMLVLMTYYINIDEVAATRLRVHSPAGPW
jgi:hypothetical protein